MSRHALTDCCRPMSCRKRAMAAATTFTAPPPSTKPAACQTREPLHDTAKTPDHKLRFTTSPEFPYSVPCCALDKLVANGCDMNANNAKFCTQSSSVHCQVQCQWIEGGIDEVKCSFIKVEENYLCPRPPPWAQRLRILPPAHTAPISSGSPLPLRPTRQWPVPPANRTSCKHTNQNTQNECMICNKEHPGWRLGIEAPTRVGAKGTSMMVWSRLSSTAFKPCSMTSPVTRLSGGVETVRSKSCNHHQAI